MSTEQLALLEELSGGQLYSSAIIGTYQFDGEFFEDEVLPVLNQLDIANIVVLTDTQTYTEASQLTQAGQAYYIDHVRCPGTHHPKFVALFGRDHGRAFLGSANLTEEGWQRSGELMTIVEYPGETGEITPLFAQLRGFIEHSTAQIYSSRATAAINEALRDAPWLPVATGTTTDDQLQLLHNYAEALLPQVLDHIGAQSIEEIEVCSPFFSGTDTETFEALCTVDPQSITINLQPGHVNGFAAEILEMSCFDGIDVTVNKISLTGDDADRYLHAKLLLLKGPAGVWAFYGSPNLTTPALMKPKASGNIELGVLRYEPDSDYFDYLLDADTVTRESIDPKSIKHRPFTSTDTADRQPDFYLSDAYLETDGTLIIKHEEATPQQATIHLRRAVNDDGFDIDRSEPENGRLQCQDDRIPQLCRQAVQVQVSLEFADHTQTSDARWVALPTLERTPRPSEVQAVETSDGRDGLLEVLDRLPNWGVICEFLENVDFNSMDVSGGGSQIGPGDPGASDGRGIEEWDPKDRDEILTEKTATLLESLETTREELVLNPTDTEQFESFVNQYVALSKLVLWWDSQNLTELSYLDNVRAATKIVCDFLKILRRHTQAEATRALEQEHAFFEHAAIIMCYVDELQQRAGYDSGVNQQVYAAFQDTNRRVVEAFGEVRGQSVPPADRLEDCLEEYSAIDTAVSVKRIRGYCERLVDTAE